jgi:hypothetical protein
VIKKQMMQGPKMGRYTMAVEGPKKEVAN